MKFVWMGIILNLIMSSTVTAKSQKPSPARQSSTKTEFHFDGSTIHGRYQSGEEALARVENEKIMNDLLGIRKDFKDRLKVQAEQR